LVLSFHLFQAYTVLDELFIAGEFCEPSLKRLMYRLEEINGQLANEALKENLGIEFDDNNSYKPSYR
jgi:hypothetical protein